MFCRVSHCRRPLTTALISAGISFAATGCSSNSAGKESQTGGNSGTTGSTNGGETNVNMSGGTSNTGGTSIANGGISNGGISSGGTSLGKTSQVGGSAPIGGATSSGGTATGTRSGWIEEWDKATASRFYTNGGAPNAVKLNAADATARDGKAVSLTLAANPKPTPNGGAEVGTNDRFSFGTFASRLRTADCIGQPNAGVVTGLFTYFNNGTDLTGDGLPDNSEIDFEWLCAEPETVYLTMWTDYRDSDGAQKRVGRAINLATGAILHTCYYTAFGDCSETLKGVEASPGTIGALSGYNSSSGYYEYGFDWATDSVVWWMIHPTSGQKIILWDYRGPKSRITQVPAAFLTNVWHTSDWPPESKASAIQPPTQAVNLWVDSTSFTAP